MARSFSDDPLMACNFALLEVPGAAVPPLVFPYKAARSAVSQGNFVGFQSMTTPEFTIEHREIRQGNSPFVHAVVAGYTTGGTITLTQAVMRLATDMYLWFLQAVKGIGGPRRNLMLMHTRLDRALPARVLSCELCLPLSWKPASDFSATDSSVSVETLTFWTQRINVITIPASDFVPDAF